MSRDGAAALLNDLFDLHKQATTERSHNYVASVVIRCIASVAENVELQSRLEKTERDLRHWREECGKLHSLMRSKAEQSP